MNEHRYFVYVATNLARSVFYTGVTRDLETELPDAIHEAENPHPNAKRLIYLERFPQLKQALRRESEIKALDSLRKQEILEGSRSIRKLLT